MGMKLNPDLKKRKEVQQKVKNNKGYCPCMIVKNENTICPCKPCREKEVCICGLYVKEEQ